MHTLVFDTGPLSHFARIQSLDVLKEVVGDRRAVVPQAVVEELRRGLGRGYRLAAVLDADWIEQRDTQSDEELGAFAEFASRLMSRDRNVGDAAVLALAKTLPGRAVIDDNVAHRIGTAAGVTCTRTLALLCEGIRTGLLTVDAVSDLADKLIATTYRLPFGPGGFADWAEANDLFAAQSNRGHR